MEFNYIVRYDLAGKCLTPLRTGSENRSMETILRRPNGQPFLQATSLAGAMRQWAGEQYPHLEDTLFGTHDKGGHLVFADVLFPLDAQSPVRPRLAMNPATGTGKDRGKFDMAHLATGTAYTSTLTWRGMKENWAQEQAVVEDLLTAIHKGEIRLGGQKTSGFGAVTLTAQRYLFDLCQEQGRTQWLTNTGTAKTLKFKNLSKSSAYVQFRVTGVMRPVLVKGTPDVLDKGTPAVNVYENNLPVVPGASVKGAVRNRATVIAHHLGIPATKIEGIFGRGAKTGDNGVAGTVIFRDTPIRESQVQLSSRIRINRMTGAVANRGLFQENVVSGNFETILRVPANDHLACALVLLALRDLGLGLYNLGSGSNVGHGYLKETSIQVTTPDKTTATLQDFDKGTCTVTDSKALFDPWFAALEAERSAPCTTNH